MSGGPEEEAGPVVPAGIDVTRPNIARVYDYLIGGKDNFPADRAEGNRLLEASPRVARLAMDNRAFLGRAVGWLASRGVRQFLDLGAGLPTGTSTHQAAQAVAPEARVVYVDRDPRSSGSVHASYPTRREWP